MKANQKVIKKGNYYQLQTMQDLIMQQKLPKKQQPLVPSVPNPSSLNPTNQLSQNIVTTLPPKQTVLKNYNVPASSKIRTDDYGLDDYQVQLEELLKLAIRDEERFQIQKILKEISDIKNCQVLPLNAFPKAKPAAKDQQRTLQAPKTINLVANYNIEKLENNIKQLQDLKYIQLSRLQHLVQILSKQQPQNQLGSQGSSQSQGSSSLDQKTKQQIQQIYNSLSQLKCLSNLPGIVNKISANEAKYIEMNNLVGKVEDMNTLNKDILDELENDDAVMNKLEESFKVNLDKVRGIIKKISQ